MAPRPDVIARLRHFASTQAVGVPIAIAIVGAIALLSTLAGADTPTNHTVRAAATTQTDIAPPGPLTNLVDKSPVTVRVTQASAQDPISGIVQIRQCKGGV